MQRPNGWGKPRMHPDDPRRPDGRCYRFVSPIRKGPWRDNRYAAKLDAVRAGFGSVEEWIREPGLPPRIYLHPFADIEVLPAEAQLRAA